jgi:hypothetical protein
MNQQTCYEEPLSICKRANQIALPLNNHVLHERKISLDSLFKRFKKYFNGPFNAEKQSTSTAEF